MAQARPAVIVGNVAIVPLTRGLCAIIDASDAPEVARRLWCALRIKGKWYAVTNRPRSDPGPRTLYLHRYLMGDGSEVDHANGNGLDCRRENLRHATRSQNNCNRPSRGNVTSYRGVARIGEGRWRAQIMLGKRYTHLGVFADPADAARAYDAAARRIHGAFARPNFKEVQ